MVSPGSKPRSGFCCEGDREGGKVVKLEGGGVWCGRVAGEAGCGGWG